MTDEDLIDILDKCRSFNEISGVTGMLLYKNGKFLQVLEGDEEVVEELYKKIVRDSRHRAAEVLLLGQRPDRQFPDWSMGFANLSNFTEQDLPAFSSFLSEGFNVEEMRIEPQQTYRLLLRFRDPMFQLGT